MDRVRQAARDPTACMSLVLTMVITPTLPNTQQPGCRPCTPPVLDGVSLCQPTKKAAPIFPMATGFLKCPSTDNRALAAAGQQVHGKWGSVGTKHLCFKKKHRLESRIFYGQIMICACLRIGTPIVYFPFASTQKRWVFQQNIHQEEHAV